MTLLEVLHSTLAASLIRHNVNPVNWQKCPLKDVFLGGYDGQVDLKTAASVGFNTGTRRSWMQVSKDNGWYVF